MMSPWLAVGVVLALVGFRIAPPWWLAAIMVAVWLLVDLRQEELARRRRRREWIRAAARKEVQRG